MQNAILIFTLRDQSNQVKRTPQDSINESIIRKLNRLLLVGDNFRFISASLHA